MFKVGGGRQWQPQPAPAFPLSPDPAMPGVTWYQDYAGAVYPGFGTYYDVVAANIDSITLVADNIDEIEQILAADYLPRDGMLPMTGSLLLAHDPVQPLEAVTLEYLQADYLALAGGSMQGTLTLAGPPQNMNDAATKSYVDQYAGVGYLGTWQVAPNNPNITAGATTAGVYYFAVTANATVPETAAPGIPGIGGQSISNGDRIIWNTVLEVWQRIPVGTDFGQFDARYVALTGSTMTGPLVLSGNATTNLEPVTLQQLNSAGYAPLASPVFTGSPQAPTPAQGDNDNSLATTAFVANALVGLPGVSSFNTRQGAVTLQLADVTSVGGAPLASPNLSGSPTSTTPAPGDNSTRIATTAFVAGYAPLASPAFTGTPTAPTPAATDSSQTVATTAFVRAAVAPALNDTGRNLIHNPAFTVWQRGAGPFTASAAYTADRWKMFLATDTVSVSQQPFGVGGISGVDEAPIWCLTNAFTGNSAAGAYTIVGQFIEDVRRLSGKTVTVSFYAAANSGTPKLGVEVAQTFGTGGSPSAQVTGTGQAFTISTWGTRYSATFAVPSIAGKTLGTNNDHATQLNFWYSSGTNFTTRTGGVGVQAATISLWGVQLEIGSAATPLAKRDPADDLAVCQRFYQLGRAFWAGQVTSGVSYTVCQALVVQMRAAPTVVITASGASGMGAQTAIGEPYDVSIAATAAGTGAGALGGYFTASADL